MKHSKKILLFCATLLLITTLFCSCGTAQHPSTANGTTAIKEGAFVTIDINPSIELTLNEDQKVTAIGAANTDAEILLWQEDLIGADLETALKRITTLAVEMGYITEENDAVSVTVTTDGGKTQDVLLENVNRTLTDAAKSAGIPVSVEEGVDLVLSRELSRIKEQNAGRDGYGESLTPARYRLIKSALRADRDLTMDKAVLMPNQDLTEIVETARRDAADRFGRACELARDEASFIYENAKQTLLDSAYTAVYAARRDLSSLLSNYGAAYAGYRLAYRTIEHYAETVRMLIENPLFTSNDVFALANALGIPTDAEEEYNAFKKAITDENGQITRDSVNAYIDQQYRNMDEEDRAALEAAYDQVLEILDRMEAEAHIIREDGRLLISGALLGMGVSMEVKTYEDIDELLGAIDKKIGDVYKKMDDNLTENEKAEVAEMQEEMSDKIAALEKTYRESIAKAQADAEAFLSAAKKERLN